MVFRCGPAGRQNDQGNCRLTMATDDERDLQHLSATAPDAAQTSLDVALDDIVVPFTVPSLDARGRIVRFGPALDESLSRHGYPEPVARVLAEAIALTALLGASLKFEGRFILQTQTDGPISMLVVDFETPGQFRACFVVTQADRKSVV